MKTSKKQVVNVDVKTVKIDDLMKIINTQKEQINNLAHKLTEATQKLDEAIDEKEKIEEKNKNKNNVKTLINRQKSSSLLKSVNNSNVHKSKFHSKLFEFIKRFKQSFDEKKISTEDKLQFLLLFDFVKQIYNDSFCHTKFIARYHNVQSAKNLTELLDQFYISNSFFEHLMLLTRRFRELEKIFDLFDDICQVDRDDDDYSINTISFSNEISNALKNHNQDDKIAVDRFARTIAKTLEKSLSEDLRCIHKDCCEHTRQDQEQDRQSPK